MSAYLDAQTPGGYTGGPNMQHQNTGGPNMQHQTAPAAGSSTSGGEWWQSLIGNAVNRYMDVETYKQTGGQLPPSYYNPNGGQRMQAINTGTQYTTNSTIAGVPVWALALGAVALVFVMRK